MEDIVPHDENSQISLCDSIKEILGLICCVHNKKDYDGSASNSAEKLELSINVKKKSEKTKDELDVFTIKVKSNQHVPMMSTIKELRTPKLIEFIGQMQGIEQESHLAVRLPDKDDPSFTRTFVLWISLRKNSAHHVQIQEEKLSKRTASADDNLVLQLRIFMKSSVLMNEVQSMSNFICCFKMLNPLVGVRLLFEGTHGVDLDLCNNEYFHCESLKVSTLSNLYQHKRSSADEVCKGDMSISKPIYACCDDGTKSPMEVACGLIFLPRYVQNYSQCEKRSSPEKQGEVFMQVYDSNRLPVDMLEFCLHFRITPDVLVPSDDFKSIIRIKGTSSIGPYNMACCVELMQDACLPQIITECNKFTLWMCFVINQDLTYLDSMTSDTMNCLKESARTVFQKLLCVDYQKDPKQDIASCTINNDHEGNIKRWVTDIATALSDIYIKSTNVSFRARVAQMAPVYTCMSMKSYLQENLETILLTNRGLYAAQPASENAKECENMENGLKEFPLSQFSSKEDCYEGRMSPDSLDMTDDEWNETVNDKNLGSENVHKSKADCKIVSEVKNFEFLQQKKCPAQVETIAGSLPEIYNCSCHENIIQDDNTFLPVRHRMSFDFSEHYQSTNNSQLTIKSMQNSMKSASLEKCHDSSNREKTLVSESESTICTADQDLNHNNVMPGMKRPIINIATSGSDSEIKKVKTDNDIHISIDYPQLTEVKTYFNKPFPNPLEINARRYRDEPQHKNVFGQESLSNLKQNSGALTNFSNHGEQTVPDFIYNEQFSDDWLNTDEFDKWCAELQD